jgi:outer membrane usher protein
MLTEEGTFFQEEDLRAIGLKDPKERYSTCRRGVYLSQVNEGVDFIFNEKTLSVEISAPPSLLPKTEIDFLPPRQSNVLYSKNNSAFLNYRLNRAQSVSPDLSSLNLTNELGVRRGEYLFLSDTSYTRTNGSENFVRLMTNITRDRREDLGRYVAGDFFASSGELGGSVNLGGFSYAKIYRIDPYFIKYPCPDSPVQPPLVGCRGLPRRNEIRTEKLPPGEFELKI